MTRDNKIADFVLWDEVRRTVKPLGNKNPHGHGPRTGKPGLVRHLMAAAPVQHQNPPGPHLDVHVVPPLQTLDRRTTQRLGRGLLEPDARLDLHGDSLESARTKLAHFIARQRQQGARLVLVITGKGASPYARHTLHGHSQFHAPEREGRLRREVPRWFGEEQFRQHIVGFQPSHPRHGGGGAYYVRLRKKSGLWP